VSNRPLQNARRRSRSRAFACACVRSDVLSNLMYFFGAPVSPEKLKDYTEHHAMTYRASAGSNAAPTALTDLHPPRLSLRWQTSRTPMLGRILRCAPRPRPNVHAQSPACARLLSPTRSRLAAATPSTT